MQLVMLNIEKELVQMRRTILLLLVLCGVILSSSAAVLAQGLTLNGFTVSYSGRAYNSSTDRTTFSYTVSGTNTPPDLSHFNLEIPDCEIPLEVVAYNPTTAVSFGVDPTTGVNGIKWDLPLRTDQTRVYSISFEGDVSEGKITTAVKGGADFAAGTIAGASCTQAGIDVVVSVSIDGGATWDDAEIPTGPIAELAAPVSFLLQIFNSGDFPLTNLTLSDSVFDASSCVLPPTLEIDGAIECIIGPFNAVEGQHVNISTASGEYEGNTYTDSDAAHYYAGNLPLITVEKLVAIAGGGAWYTADSAPGLIVPNDEQVSFRFVVTNEGTEEFTQITLSDSQFPIEGCQIPAALLPTETFECIIGPFDVDDDDAQINTLTLTAVANGQTVTVTDAAHYQASDDDETGTIIIIEGPVEVIIQNVIVIYGIEIELDENDPLLTVIQIGDIVHIEGDLIENGTTIIVIAIVVVIIDIDIYIVDGGFIWRDDGNCNNAPPPWAPAHGWRRKCQTNNVIIIIGGGGMGMGMGNNDNDSGDDD